MFKFFGNAANDVGETDLDIGERRHVHVSVGRARNGISVRAGGWVV